MQYYKETLPDYDYPKSIDKKQEIKQSPESESESSSSDSADEECKSKKVVSAAEQESNLKEASLQQWEKLQSVFGSEKANKADLS